MLWGLQPTLTLHSAALQITAHSNSLLLERPPGPCVVQQAFQLPSTGIFLSCPAFPSPLPQMGDKTKEENPPSLPLQMFTQCRDDVLDAAYPDDHFDWGLQQLLERMQLHPSRSTCERQGWLPAPWPLCTCFPCTGLDRESQELDPYGSQSQPVASNAFLNPLAEVMGFTLPPFFSHY
ncbi:uncharacterized protein ACIB01_013460 isoform 1-T1 [Guaruba guarouba]